MNNQAVKAAQEAVKKSEEFDIRYYSIYFIANVNMFIDCPTQCCSADSGQGCIIINLI